MTTTILEHRPRILVVDDESEHAATLVRLLTREGWDARSAPHGADALDALRAQPFDVVLTDLIMPGQTGLDVLQAVRHLQLPVDVVLMTAFGTVERAVEAMRAGAEDFLVKPIRRAQLQRALERCLDRRRLARTSESLQARLPEARRGAGLIAAAPTFLRALTLAEQAAPSDATILLLGESGTGKELVARMIHQRSPRAERPLVTLHCAALPESIIESELFGHEPGAFTGATRRRTGRIEEADGGTLFLDEVGDIPLGVQVKLLRLLQQGEITRLGSTQVRTVDVRVVAATHRDLSLMIREGTFREDLYYRLHVIPIHLPPLRERPEDIELLAEHFVRLLGPQKGRDRLPLSSEALQRLVAWHWPGNVRELQNVIERAVVLDRDGVLGPDDLPAALSGQPVGRASLQIEVGTPMAEVERRMILATLAHTGGDKALAARLLGVGRRTIYRRLEEFGHQGAMSTAEGDGGEEDDTRSG
jgi:two-component system response regulator HydG